MVTQSGRTLPDTRKGANDLFTNGSPHYQD